MDKLIIIPTYNECENIETLLDRLLALPFGLEVLVVDDNSPDGTGDLVAARESKDPRIHLLRRPGKMGLGSAYVAGFRYALAHGAQLVFEMDADFSHDPRFLKDLIHALDEGADLAIGSRYKEGVNVINWPMSRLVLSSGANWYARFVTGLPLTDSTGGFKAFRRKVLEAIPFDRVRSNGYSFQIEMSYRAWKKGFRLVEVPIIFTDRVEGQSKMNKRIVREAIWMVWWLRLQALTRRL